MSSCIPVQSAKSIIETCRKDAESDLSIKVLFIMTRPIFFLVSVLGMFLMQSSKSMADKSKCQNIKYFSLQRAYLERFLPLPCKLHVLHCENEFNFVLSYSRGQQVNLCYQTSISLIFCYCSDSFSASSQTEAYKSSI